MLATVAVSLALVAPSPAENIAVQPPTPIVRYHRWDYKNFARRVYLHRQKIRKPAKRRLKHLISHQYSEASRSHLRRWRRGIWDRRRAWLESLRSTPYGQWAIPAYIVMCESGGNYQAQNPSGAYGAYQLMPTWWSHLGRKPTPAEQDAIAAKLWNGGAGRGNWVCA